MTLPFNKEFSPSIRLRACARANHHATRGGHKFAAGRTTAHDFKTRGGTVTFDGYPLTHRVESQGRRVTMNVGDRVVIFGAYEPRDGKWLFTAIDVFEVRGDVVMNELPAIEPFAETFPPQMTIAVFAQKVRDLAARLR